MYKPHLNENFEILLLNINWQEACMVIITYLQINRLIE